MKNQHESALLYAGVPTNDQYDDPGYCNRCGAKGVTHTKPVYDSNIMCEVYTKCNACGFEDFWAYGFFESNEEMVGKARKYSRI